MLNAINKRPPEEPCYMDIFNNSDPDHDIFFQDKPHRTVHWSVSWSDLMMTMFILFLFLYIYHSANQKFLFGDKTDDFSDVKEDAIAELLDDSSDMRYGQNIIKAEYINDVASINLVKDKAIRIVLPGDLLFDTGKAAIKPEAVESLSDIAEIIKKTSHMVNVIGHTDDVPLNSEKFPTNWELSAFRASIVARFLIEEMGISANRFFISGHSYLMPVKPNTSNKNRAANRRVEIVLFKNKPGAIQGSFSDFY